MKKIIFVIFLILILTQNVFATNEQGIDKVLYKWYKEEKIDSTFHPKKDKLTDYIEEENIVQYGEYSDWKNNFCSYPQEYYLIEEKQFITYEELLKTKYIKLKSIYNIGTSDSFEIIKIYYDSNEISYKIVEYSTYIIRLELEKEYDTSKLEFYIESGDARYFLYLANDIDFNKITVSYSVVPWHDGRRLIWNNEWISEKSTYEKKTSETMVEENKAIRNIKSENICRVREINTYRYKIKKTYYDNEYHVFVEGYLPDVDNRVIYYDDNKQEESIESHILKKEEQYENEIIEKEFMLEEEKKQHLNTVKNMVNIQTHIKEKIPIKIYILIIVLIIIIIFQIIIKIISKNVD